MHAIKPNEFKQQTYNSKDKLSRTTDSCVKLVVVEYIGDRAPLKQTSKRFFNKFQHDKGIVTALLSFVAQGNQYKAEQLSNPKHFLVKADVTDYSFRAFKCISAYEYALWAGDKHMARMIEDKVRHATNPDAECIRTELLRQWRELKLNRKGLHYTLNDQEYCEVEYNPKSLFAAYQFYITNYQTWVENSQWVELNQAWCAVGSQQKLMPAHAIQEMCMKRSFKPIPRFEESRLVRAFDICDYMTGIAGKVFPLGESITEGLGINFALGRTITERPLAQVTGQWGGGSHGAVDDREALKSLFEIRNSELSCEPNFKKDDITQVIDRPQALLSEPVTTVAQSPYPTEQTVTPLENSPQEQKVAVNIAYPQSSPLQSNHCSSISLRMLCVFSTTLGATALLIACTALSITTLGGALLAGIGAGLMLGSAIGFFNVPKTNFCESPKGILIPVAPVHVTELDVVNKLPMPFEFISHRIGRSRTTKLTIQIADCNSPSDKDIITIEVAGKYEDCEWELIKHGRNHGTVSNIATPRYPEYLITYKTPTQIVMAINLILSKIWDDNFKAEQKSALVSYQLNTKQYDLLLDKTIDFIVRPRINSLIDMILSHSFEIHGGAKNLGAKWNNKSVTKHIFNIFPKLLSYQSSDALDNPITLAQFKALYHDVCTELAAKPQLKTTLFKAGKRAPSTDKLYRDCIELLGLFEASMQEIYDAILEYSPLPKEVAGIIRGYCA
ncbi:MAG: hypothetical protein H0U75_09765 [Legionella sp.]|nr:hypothetical protein [Legionella sp.]